MNAIAWILLQLIIFLNGYIYIGQFLFSTCLQVYLQDDYKFILLPDKTCNVYAQTAYSNEYWNS